MSRGYQVISNLPWIRRDFSPLSTKSQCILSQIETVPNDLSHGLYSLQKIIENFLCLLIKERRYNDRFGKWDYNGGALEKVNFQEHFDKRKDMSYKLVEMALRWFPNTVNHACLCAQVMEEAHGPKRENEELSLPEPGLVYNTYVNLCVFYSLNKEVSFLSWFLFFSFWLDTTDLWKCYLDLLRLLIFFLSFKSELWVWVVLPPLSCPRNYI